MSLQANAFLYETCRNFACEAILSGDPAGAGLAEMAAGFAWQQHPGLFADGALENSLLGLGKRLSVEEGLPGTTPPGQGTTLHVASGVYPTGGHSRVLTKWMLSDTGSSHALVLTRQRDPIPGFLRDIWTSLGIEPTVLDPLLPIERRAAMLRALSRTAARIVLHHHPDDPVPVIAYAEGKSAPVILFNHAHFSFGLGTSVADLVLNTLPYYGELSRTRRAARQVAYVTGPINSMEPISTEPVDKRAAKLALGLPAAAPVAMTIGHSHYFNPAGDQNFFDMAISLLREEPRLFLLFVGFDADFEHVPDELRGHDRVRFCGSVPDPSPYYRAADLCLESYPMPSLGAVVEAVVTGEAYPVLSYCRSENIIRPGIPGWPTRPRALEDYMDSIKWALQSPQAAATVAREIRISSDVADRTFGDQVRNAYRLAAAASPASSPLPDLPAQSTGDDLLLAEIGGNRFAACVRSIPRASLRLRCMTGGLAAGHLRMREMMSGLRGLARDFRAGKL